MPLSYDCEAVYRYSAKPGQIKSTVVSVNKTRLLTHWSPNIMIGILQTPYYFPITSPGRRHIQLISPWKNGRYFAGDILKYILANEKFCILIRISLKFVPKGQIHNKSALVHVMAWMRNRRQAITWTNADPVHWRISATLGVCCDILNESSCVLHKIPLKRVSVDILITIIAFWIRSHWH